MIIQEIKKTIEISKAGKPYARVLLKFEEYKDGKGNYKWISGFGNKRTWEWKAGDDVEPIITENGEYLNFSFDDTKENMLDVYRLPATVGMVIDLFEKRFGGVKISQAPATTTTPATITTTDKTSYNKPDYGSDINPDDIPF
jgi:hypothetical protein